MYINVFYFHTLNSIGGIETFFWQLGKKYGADFDITVFYREGCQEQIERLSKYVRVKRYRDGMKIRCKRMFVCFNTDILDNVEAEEYYQMLHGDYVSLGVYPDKDPKINKWISVSETVRDSYKVGMGEEGIICYNPFTPEKPRKVLNLISATRLTKDKGLGRMEALASALDKADIPYLWTVFTDVTSRVVHHPNVVLMPARQNITDYIANADYLVQLSDAEGYCYTVVEALSAGTPVIVTDFKVIHEIGVKDGVNGWVLPMDMSSIPVEDIYKGLRKFKYTAPEDCWGELLVPGESDYAEKMKQIVRVRCKRVYYDLKFEREMVCGEEWEVPMLRADKLLDLGLVDLVGE